MGRLLQGWINPLKFTELEGPPPPDTHPTADQILDYLSPPGSIIGTVGFIERYKEIARIDDAIPIVPGERNILEKFVWPLRNAKGSVSSPVKATSQN